MTFTKGRDWFDFMCYISKKIVPNYTLLKNSIDQEGPWKRQNITVTETWLIDALVKKIEEIDWANAKKDVENFLSEQERESLNIWSTDFFLAMVNKFSKT